MKHWHLLLIRAGLCLLLGGLIGPSTLAQDALRDLLQRSTRFMPEQVDSALAYADRAVILAEFEEKDRLIVRAVRHRAEILIQANHYREALPDLLRSRELEDILGNYGGEARDLTSIGEVYRELDTLDSARVYYRAALDRLGKAEDVGRQAKVYLALGELEEGAGNQNLAHKMYVDAARLARKVEDRETAALANLQLGFLFLDKKRFTLSRGRFRDALNQFERTNDRERTVRAQYGLARVSQGEKKYLVAENYARKGLKLAREIGSRASTMDLYQLLGDLMKERGRDAEAAEYYQLNNVVRDSLLGDVNARQLSDIVAGYEKKQLRLENEKIAQQVDLERAKTALAEEELKTERLRSYIILGGLILVGIFLAVLARAVILKNRANRRLRAALDSLQRAQNQLVRTEKLASLGQVTAGIAHEIRNPLNFVNSLSRLSVDMVDEAAEELTDLQGQPFSGDSADTVFEYFRDIRTNSGKVLEHGQRASRIVTDMLRHAGGSEKQKESVAVDQFVEEYLQVAFHSMRGKPGAFDCAVEFVPGMADKAVPMVRADLGRALLNVIGNAFEALGSRVAQEGPEFGPRLKVVTQRVGSELEIRVQDNGPGVPDDHKDKVFEPFFTTKPPNQGTGLGLSLAFETVAKGHQGQITVQDAEGGGAVFLIRLPLEN
ncbi:MAG: ATP-binding protein [Bacteroidota bacterium]